MGVRQSNMLKSLVALHPEGVDRNDTIICDDVTLKEVALHPEGVDRNFPGLAALKGKISRPPPGGRG